MATHSKTLTAWQAIYSEQSSVAGYSPQDCKKWDMMEMTQHSTAQYCNIKTLLMSLFANSSTFVSLGSVLID